MPRFLTRLFLYSLAAFLPSAAAAQNLLGNGGFASDLSSWNLSGPSIPGSTTWSPLDAGGSAASGSVQIVNASTSFNSNNKGLNQCRAVTPGASYDYGVKSRVPTGQANTAIVYILINFYSSPGCTPGDLLSGFGRLDNTVPANAWSGRTGTVVAPAGAVSAVVYLYVFKLQESGTVTAYFDDAFFAPTGSLRATLTVPVAASIHGANNTFFHSDLWIFNRSFTNTNTVTAVYRCFGGSGCGSAQTITLLPRRSMLIQDIIGTLFQVPESGGAIELSYDTFNGPITAQTRLFTPAAPPSYGFGVPALPSSAATTRAVFVGVAGNPDLTKGFRSNGGAYNPSAAPVTVTFTLYDGTTNAQIGNPFARVWGPFEAAQVSNLVTSLGSTAATTNAVLVATATGPVFFYLATVDNSSGDSFLVTASPDEPPVP